MAHYRYRIKNINSGELLNTNIDLDQDVENPWKDEGFKFDGSWHGFTDSPKNYEIIKEDISAEIAAREAKEQARKDATARLKALNGQVNPTQLADTLSDILEHLGLKK